MGTSRARDGPPIRRLAERVLFVASTKGKMGTPKYLYSDQAGYFTRANEELKESHENMEEGLKQLQNNGQILWRFNVSKEPHEAGTWERLVKSTKHVLLKICRNAFLNHVKFQMVLKET